MHFPPHGLAGRVSWLPLAVAAVAASLAVLAVGTGCGNLGFVTADSTANFQGDAGSPDAAIFRNTGLDTGVGTAVPLDATPAAYYQGSPLCAMASSGSVCDPDNPTEPDAGPLYSQCVTEALPPVAVPDAGAPATDGSTPITDGGAILDGEAGTADTGTVTDAADGAPTSNGVFACHVVPNGSVVAPTCTLAGTGGDGATCKTGTDCAAGFECVGLGTTGTCRQYCCDNLCGPQPIADAGPNAVVGDAATIVPGTSFPFCSIQPMTAYSGNAVPVCLKKATCALFQPCPVMGETCTIVDSRGTTACTLPGGGVVGDSCETTPCGEGLACWGTFPSRSCVQLCNVSGSPVSCPMGQSCSNNYANFANTSTTDVGICQ